MSSSALPAAPAAPADSGLYSVIVFLNATPGRVTIYEHGQALSEYTADGTLLRFAFQPGRRDGGYRDVVDRVADAAFVVGSGYGADDLGGRWPDGVRSLSMGDVLQVTAPDGTVDHRFVAAHGFHRIEAPATSTLTFPLARVLAAAEHAAAAAVYRECEEMTEHPAHLCLGRDAGEGVRLASNAAGWDRPVVHAHGHGPASPLPDAMSGLFHAIDLFAPLDDAPDLFTLLRADLAEGAARFLLAYDPKTLTLTTSTD